MSSDLLIAQCIYSHSNLELLILYLNSDKSDNAMCLSWYDKLTNGKSAGCSTQWLARLTRKLSDVDRTNCTKSDRDETLHSLLSTGWFQERIRA